MLTLRKIAPLFLLLPLLMLFSCRQPITCDEPIGVCGFGQTSGCDGDGISSIQDFRQIDFACPPLEVQGQYPDDEVTLGDLTIVGDCMNLTVRFGGASTNHPVAIVWDGTFSQGTFPTATLRVYHDQNGDMGEAYLAKQVMRNLAEIRYPESNIVLVEVVNHAGETVSALYEY